MISFIQKAAVLRSIAHPAKIAILDELSNGVKCVTDLHDLLDIRQSNISQHLSVLRHAGFIDFFIDGKLRCYFLKDPIIPDLLKIFNKEYAEGLPGPECCPFTEKGTYYRKRG